MLLSLGSNLGDRVQNIYRATDEIEKMIGRGRVIIHAPLYESKAWGTTSAFDYINTCIWVQTDLPAETALEYIHEIEHNLGRVRGKKYQDRTIDIDILLYNQQIISTEHLTIPHPHMHERLFVLVPAHQIVPNVIHPIFNKTIKQLLLECNDDTNVYEYKIPPDGEQGDEIF